MIWYKMNIGVSIAHACKYAEREREERERENRHVCTLIKRNPTQFKCYLPRFSIKITMYIIYYTLRCDATCTSQ